MSWSPAWLAGYANYRRALHGLGAIHSVDPMTGINWIEVPAGTVIARARVGRRTMEAAYTNPRPLLVAETVVTRQQWLLGTRRPRSNPQASILPPSAVLEEAQRQVERSSPGGGGDELAEMLRTGQGGSTRILQRGSGRYGQQTEADRQRAGVRASPVGLLVENPPPVDLPTTIGSHRLLTDPQMPADTVDFQQAAEFCKRIGARLPTVNEWAFATLGGQERNPYGRIEDIAWFEENSWPTDELKIAFIHYGIFENHMAPLRARDGQITKDSLLDSVSEDERIPDHVYEMLEDASRAQLIEVERWYIGIRRENVAYLDPAMHPVAQKQANRLGLYDMLGNVWQWTISSSTYGGAAYVVGGSYATPADDMEYVNIAQMVVDLGTHMPGIGFRPVKDIAPRAASRVEMIEIMSAEEQSAPPPAPPRQEDRRIQMLEIAEATPVQLQPLTPEAAALIPDRRMQMLEVEEMAAPAEPATVTGGESIRYLDLDEPAPEESLTPEQEEAKKKAEEEARRKSRISNIELDGFGGRFRSRRRNLRARRRR